MLSPDTKLEVLVNADGEFLGLGQVEVQGIAVRNGALPFMVRAIDRDPSSRTARVVSHLTGIRHNSKTGEVVLSIRQKRPGTTIPEDRVDWHLRPENWTIRGRKAKGFSYSFEFRNERRPIHRLVESSSWCLGKGVEGLRFIEQSEGYGRGSRDISIGKDTIIKSQSPLVQKETPESRQAVGDYVDFLSGANSSFVRFVAEPSLTFRDVTRQPGQSEVRTSEEYATPLTTHFRSPRVVVLIYPGSGVNAWFAIRDAVAEHLRNRAGIHSAPPRPWVALTAFDLADWTTDDDVPRRLDFYQRMGFKRLWKWSLWQTNWSEWDKLSENDRKLGAKALSHSVLRLEWSDKVTVDQIEKLCRGAAARDMKVIMWFPTAHLSPASPLLKENPDWNVRRRDGTPYQYVYDEIVGVFHAAGYSAYALARLRALKQQVGFGGVYFDSAQLYGYDAIQYGDPKWPLQWPAILAFTRDLEREGLTVMAECGIPFAVPASTGFLQKEEEDPEYLLYKTSPHSGGAKSIDPHRYFRLMAFMAPRLVPEDVWWNSEALQELGGYVNRAFNRRVSFMKHCTMLPDGRGTLWWDAGQTAGTLFSFKSGSIDIGRKLTSAKEVESNTGAVINGTRLQVEAYKVYALKP